jgi:FtsP/CotA-like multicopper oxidase with cupredoxin domain
MDFSGFGWKSQNMLQLPVLLEDINSAPDITEYQLNVQEGQTEFLDGKLTDTMGYNSSYLGPVLRFTKGQQTNITVKNNLDTSTTLHWHGLLVDGEQDGGPMQGIQPNQSWNPSFVVDQPAATLWYHPHFIGTTADQVYYGLAGLIYIEDDISKELDLPDIYGINDIPLIIQDRNFNRDGSFDYRTSMMGVVPGEEILINGTIKPYLNIKQEKIRFRILNASNSENLNLNLSSGESFLVIASDGGFLRRPIVKKSLFLAPGERVEIIIDFSKEKKESVTLSNENKKILEFKVTDKLEKSPGIKDELAVISEIPIGDNPVNRVFELESMGINGTINGKYYDMNRIDEEVRLNESEIWVIRNLGGMMQTGGHPFHVHGTQFQIISRDGKIPPPEESGFKDTVFVEVGEEVLLRVVFKHKGIFMYHCHILEHEDNGMMGQFKVQ